MTGRTYLDCYGSLADTAVAEDGNFEEHSWWGSLFSRFGIKQKSRFGLNGTRRLTILEIRAGR